MADARRQRHDVPDLLQWCLDRGYELRFIEQMPLDAQHAWDRSHMVTQAEILERLGERFTLTPVGSGAARPRSSFWSTAARPTVGVIASVTAPFCGSCDRVRLTADGQLRNCLFARAEDDLRGPAGRRRPTRRSPTPVIAEMWAKKAGHGIDRPDFLQPDRPMSAIGG